jgi:uncharacterized OB-fold protein
VATAVQTECDRCGSPLEPGAAYCDKCGERTRKARGLVTLTLRVELVVLALIALITIGFVVAFFVQR